MYLKLTIKTRERCQWRRSGVFIVNFVHVSHLFLVFLLVSLNNQMLAWFYLHCHHFSQFRQTLLDFVEQIVKDISNVRDNTFVNFFKYVSPTYNFEIKTKNNQSFDKLRIKYRKVLLGPLSFFAQLLYFDSLNHAFIKLALFILFPLALIFPDKINVQKYSIFFR